MTNALVGCAWTAGVKDFNLRKQAGVTRKLSHADPVGIEMINFDRKAVVRTSWIIKNEEDFSRLTSCYVKT
jgi:hypothetical protein